jgi:hypothetical protein
MDVMVVDSHNNVLAYEVKKGRGTNYQGFYNGIGEAVRNLEHSNFSYLVYFNKDIANKEAKRLRMLVKRHTDIGLKIARDFAAKRPQFLEEHDMDKNRVENLRALARKMKRNAPGIS